MKATGMTDDFDHAITHAAKCSRAILSREGRPLLRDAAHRVCHSHRAHELWIAHHARLRLATQRVEAGASKPWRAKRCNAVTLSTKSHPRNRMLLREFARKLEERGKAVCVLLTIDVRERESRVLQRDDLS